MRWCRPTRCGTRNEGDRASACTIVLFRFFRFNVTISDLIINAQDSVFVFTSALCFPLINYVASANVKLINFWDANERCSLVGRFLTKVVRPGPINVYNVRFRIHVGYATS